jgi:DGQHR domain-containing protein
MANGLVKCPATPGIQSGLRIYSGILKAGDLIGVTTVHYYNSELPPEHPDQGYQRPPERSRITSIGSYLIKGIIQGGSDGDGLFPTAVTLAARQPLRYNETERELRIEAVPHLQVIDGQHRIAGMRYAIEEKGEEQLRGYPIPCVIIETPDRITEMNQFRIINGTAKSVRTDLVNTILTATAAARGEDTVKAKDRWRIVVTRVVDKLENDLDSPWAGLIMMPDKAGSPTGSDGKIIRATSFMTSLRPVYDWLKNGNLLEGKTIEDETELLFGIVASYWRALEEVVSEAFADPGEYVIQKTPGIFSLHKLLSTLLPRMWSGRQDWLLTESFIKFLQDSPEITSPMFWHKKENRASAYGSMKGFDELYKLLLLSIERRP